MKYLGLLAFLFVAGCGEPVTEQEYVDRVEYYSCRDTTARIGDYCPHLYHVASILEKNLGPDLLLCTCEKSKVSPEDLELARDAARAKWRKSQ